MLDTLAGADGAMHYGQGAGASRLQIFRQHAQVEISHLGDVLTVVVVTTATLLAARARASCLNLHGPQIVPLAGRGWWDGDGYGLGMSGLVEAYYV